MNLLDSNSYQMMYMSMFHDFIMMILLMIMIFIFYIIYWTMINDCISLMIMHNQLLEVVWTLIPVVVLVFMVFPSLKILYMVEEMLNPFMTLKIIGHQWFWVYEYNGLYDLELTSFMTENCEEFRLLDVDNRLILPVKTKVRGLVTAVDVIHSWAMPSLGIKVDAVPGRLNQCFIYMDRTGLFYGQCSEICGLNHSFMPIVIEGVKLNYFCHWLCKGMCAVYWG
uniref:Cytochrome c oxidase subunit 2 n=1 Tax=Dinocampus coccinellae TaxID=144245 RepID=A0A343YVC4_9HYME|nr:cytochrome c oxidase subunit 2 [Dinocampus coccinellae]